MTGGAQIIVSSLNSLIVQALGDTGASMNAHAISDATGLPYEIARAGLRELRAAGKVMHIGALFADHYGAMPSGFLLTESGKQAYLDLAA